MLQPKKKMRTFSIQAMVAVTAVVGVFLSFAHSSSSLEINDRGLQWGIPAEIRERKTSFADYFVPYTDSATPQTTRATNSSTTDANTDNPVISTSPSSSPNCELDIPDIFTTLVVVNLRLWPGEEGCEIDNTTFPIDQITNLFQSSYNNIVDQNYSPCDDSYRMVIDMEYVEVVENGTDTDYGIPPSFSFRRQLKKADLTERTQHSLRGNARRRAQQETIHTSWNYVSTLFEVTVACRGIFCIGDNAELFGDLIVGSANFTQAYVETVEKHLAWEPYSNCSPSDDDASLSVSTVRELTEQSCPTADELDESDSSRNVIVELMVPDEEVVSFTNPQDPRFAPIEDAYVFTYNQLIRNEFCDPLFRRVKRAKVVAIGTTANTNVIAVEMNLSVQSRGNFSSDMDVYDIPTIGMDPGNASSTPPRYLTESTSSVSDEFLYPSIPILSKAKGRKLEDLEDETCFCDAQPFGRRAPFEAEFVSRFKLFVDAMESPGISTTNSCKFRKMFTTGVVISFSKAELRKLQETGEDIKPLLELALKDTFNELLAPTEETCNTDFRVVESVEAIFRTTGIESNSSETGMNSAIGKRSGGERNLQSESPSELRSPILRIANGTDAKSSPSIKCADRETNSTLDAPTNFTSSENATNIDCHENSPTQSMGSPISTAFDPRALDHEGNTDPVLFFIFGKCSGCEDSMLTGLHNDVRRRLMQKVSKLSRELKKGGEVTRSDCFCPLNATQTNEKLEASIVSDAYEENLRQHGLNYNARIIAEVDVALCDDSKESNGAMDLTLTRSVKETLQIRGICNVVGLDDYYKSYFNLEPTSAPSNEPTKITSSPSDIPTKEPTENPTETPTRIPTRIPTKKPTRKPTRHPTIAPTRQPTQYPTSTPTPKPSQNPTSTPTRPPSQNPTSTPTHQPSKNPTSAPSPKPITKFVSTDKPTFVPTHKVEPTDKPTPEFDDQAGLGGTTPQSQSGLGDTTPQSQSGLGGAGLGGTIPQSQSGLGDTTPQSQSGLGGAGLGGTTPQSQSGLGGASMGGTTPQSQPGSGDTTPQHQAGSGNTTPQHQAGSGDTTPQHQAGSSDTTPQSQAIMANTTPQSYTKVEPTPEKQEVAVKGDAVRQPYQATTATWSNAASQSHDRFSPTPETKENPRSAP